MSIVVRQSLFLVSSGVFFAVFVLRLARRKLLSFRFVVAWLTLGLAGVLAGAFMFEVKPLSDGLGVTPATLGLAVSLVIQVGIAIELSVSASRVQNQNRTLAESIAILEDRVAELERTPTKDGTSMGVSHVQ